MAENSNVAELSTAIITKMISQGLIKDADGVPSLLGKIIETLKPTTAINNDGVVANAVAPDPVSAPVIAPPVSVAAQAPVIEPPVSVVAQAPVIEPPPLASFTQTTPPASVVSEAAPLAMAKSPMPPAMQTPSTPVASASKTQKKSVVKDGDSDKLPGDPTRRILREDGFIKTSVETGDEPAVPIEKSITEDGEWIICLENGKKLRTLTNHLRAEFGFTPDEYRYRWGLSKEYPMSAPNTARHRQLITQLRMSKKHS